MPSLRMMPKVMTLTDAAASRVAALIAQKPGVKALKIGVKKGGCAGMEYTMTWADEIGKFDEIIEEKGAIVLIDPAAIMYLIGTRDGLQDRQALVAVRVQQPEPEERLRLRRERQPRTVDACRFRSRRKLKLGPVTGLPTGTVRRRWNAKLNGRVKPGHIVMGCSILDGTLLKAFSLCRALSTGARICA